jgi:RNA polymerase II subunit A small phosphatase-like protein
MPAEEPPAQDPILLILDLDETLIHAAEQPLERPADWRLGPYSVYCRPYLAEFLAAVAQSFALAVWSSGTIDYVEAMVARIMPHGRACAGLGTRSLHSAAGSGMA